MTRRTYRSAPDRHFSGGHTLGKIEPMHDAPDMHPVLWALVPLFLVGLWVVS